MFRVVIPARYASARLPGKVLREIAGKPMLQWVYERACAAGAREVLIATDDDLIISAAHAFGAVAEMTARAHASGTDRIAEVARAHGWAAEEIVVNVQADEPLIPAALIRQVGALLESQPQADIGTLATAVESLAELLDTNAVKVVCDAQGRALYFSRAPDSLEPRGRTRRACEPGRFQRRTTSHRPLRLPRPRAPASGTVAAGGPGSARKARAAARARARSLRPGGRGARAPRSGREHARRSGACRSAAGAHAALTG